MARAKAKTTKRKTPIVNPPGAGTREDPKLINMALQGGGAHGALAWGVLDKFCEDGRIRIDGFSACSAGAMNAVVYAYGRTKNGLDGARQALHDFWEEVSGVSQNYTLFPAAPWQKFFYGWQEMDLALSYMALDNFTRQFSPYEFNPMNINPLRQILERQIDFDALKKCHHTKLFINATNVRTNKIRVFTNREITVDAVMASACLPQIFQAVEIDGEAYWDGGYMGNPALYPLVYETKTDDIVIVHINPIYREQLPKTATEITNRVNEISFNSSLLREMRAIEFAKRLVQDDMIKPEFRDHFHFKNLNMHSIRCDKVMQNHTVASKSNPDWAFLTLLRDEGRALAADWIQRHIHKIGHQSTIDLKEVYE